MSTEKIDYKMSELSKRERQAILLAWSAADTSEDYHQRNGACSIRVDKSVGGVGYNGPPPNVEIDWSDRDGRRKYMAHAEENCLAYVKPFECNIVGTTMFPCARCLNTMARYGIKTVVFINYYNPKSGWGDEKDIFDMAKVYGMTIKRAIDFYDYIAQKVDKDKK